MREAPGAHEKRHLSCHGNVNIIEHAFGSAVNRVQPGMEEPANEGPAAAEDEDDFTGYFLEPTANSVNIVERIAEANRKLYEEDASLEKDGERPRKVQFSESVTNLGPEVCYSDDFVESDENSNLEDDVIKEEEPESVKDEVEEVIEEIKPEEETNVKVLLVMLPREQSSSCESVIGEEIPGEKPPPVEKTEPEPAKVVKAPRARTPSPCKLAKISPDLNCSPRTESTKWERKKALKCRKPKEQPKIPAEKNSEAPDRPKTAADRKCCCVARGKLPKYNGFRSEYGLSAEQLQERKRKTFELRQQKRTDRMKKRQEEMQRRKENEENFSQWLLNKRRGPVVKRSNQVDTLSRSDVYIQNHAVYASRRGISYRVEYGLGRKRPSTSSKMLLLDRKNEKFINLDRLFDNISPHVKHTYRIYLSDGAK
ncbi:UNVERIFIED_CONTAM: hypothetical protein PYX00_002187 [Menopon gallinae]|uniref:Coiled-coil domain-containing protein 181 n=1 Tax=Menopon gallinae TaxID=328185 RepID=A0AAW2IH59_9NEOP